MTGQEPAPFVAVFCPIFSISIDTHWFCLAIELVEDGLIEICCRWGLHTCIT